MKYRYSTLAPVDVNAKWTKRPMLQIEVFGAQESRSFEALIDSGADISLFNAEIAEVLGIALSSAHERRFTGISGTIPGYLVENVKIRIDGINDSLFIPVCFVQSPTVGLLLGGEGFFDQCRIKFEKHHDIFEVDLVQR
ncbi:MAG: retropepsin-like domain-containing protein [Candidatus Yonathbacteria bacterium]|nr:retropepsin-like domain-containing protein [Candidatus Yonathbacteria bacterium]